MHPYGLSFLAPPGEVCDWRMVLLFDAACEAGLDRALADGPANGAEVASRSGLDAHAVRVVLECLEVWSLVERDDQGRFHLGSQWPDGPSAAALRHHGRAIRSWSAGIDDRIRGIGPRGDGRQRPRLGLWLEALAVRARQCAPGVVDACLDRLPNLATVLELGGGHGEYGLEFARRGLTVTMQDRREVVEMVGDRLRPRGVEPFAGDFFQTLPARSFDLVFCAGVNHTFDKERNRELCRRAASVSGPGGALAVVTYLRGRDAMAPIFAVQMLTAGSGADTHSEADFRRWLAEAGYGRAELVDGAHPRETLLLARRR